MSWIDKDIVKDKLYVAVDPPEIQSIHMAPGKTVEATPAIVKHIHFDVTYRIVKVRRT